MPLFMSRDEREWRKQEKEFEMLAANFNIEVDLLKDINYLISELGEDEESFPFDEPSSEGKEYFEHCIKQQKILQKYSKRFTEVFASKIKSTRIGSNYGYHFVINKVFSYPYLINIDQAPSAFKHLDPWIKYWLKFYFEESSGNTHNPPIHGVIKTLSKQYGKTVYLPRRNEGLEDYENVSVVYWLILFLNETNGLDILEPYLPTKVIAPTRVMYELLVNGPLKVEEQLRDGNHFTELFYFLDGVGRFQEALELLLKMGQANYGECGIWGVHGNASSKKYNQHVERLKGRAQLLEDNHPQIDSTTDQLKEKLEYGEITQKEYERLVKKNGSFCKFCGESIDSDSKFCKFCGKRL